jgi:dihydroorotase
MILKNAKIISPKDDLNGIFDISIDNGVITQISPTIDADGIDLTGKVIISGMIEMHCHLRTPGFEYKEDIESGIASALAGGYVAICPMANTNPVVDNIDTLDEIYARAKGIGLFQICAITKGLKGQELVDFEALYGHGAIAFSDDGRPLENMDLYEKALKTGHLIISHAEDSETLSEELAVERELNLLRKSCARLHFAHISTKKSIDLIRKAKEQGLNVTCETAPHYFTFNCFDVTQDGRFKMNPPLRTKEDVAAIIEGLKDGTIDCIATDHAPHSLDEKTRSFDEAPFGIVGFETALGASMSLVHTGVLSMLQLVEKLSLNPAEILGLCDYGCVKVGTKANLTIIDPDFEWVVDEKSFRSKCKISPFNNMPLKGKAIASLVGGEFLNLEEQYANNR